ncbi:MAG: polymer-forming cytoskeletal protein [Acidaminococcaceae bacterium]|nr:polymer-forming cytoskeletal protein [Acidaminococcaceae bacterium]
MFGSSHKNLEEKLPATSVSSEAREFVISKDSVINGNVSTNEPARIDGTIEGSVSVENSLYIGLRGAVSGPVFCQVAVIDGCVNGNLICKGAVRLSSTAKITGDLQCTSLVVAQGAYFSGKVICVDSVQKEAQETDSAEAVTGQ